MMGLSVGYSGQRLTLELDGLKFEYESCLGFLLAL